MADNFGFDPGTTSTGAADDVGGVLYPRVKINVGADGEASDVDGGQQTMANSIPVAIASNQSDVPVTLDSEAVTLGAGTATIGKLGANSGVDIGDVDVTSSALPTGASTSANQTTIIGHVDGIETLLTTIDSDTSDIATDTGTIAGDTTSIDGKITACNTGDVTIGAAIPAGTNLIGSVGIDQTTDGTTNKVSLSTDVVAVDATGQGDVPVTLDGEAITANLGATDNAVLDDIAANQTDASQKTQIVDGAGNVVGSTSNALDVNIKSGAGSGGTASDDDADFTAGTTSGTPGMGVYESSPTSVTDGDMGIVGITQTRALKVAQQGTVTVDLGANNDVTVTGTVDLGATDNAVLDTIASNTGSTKTAVETIDNAISGSEMQVDIVASLPAGTNGIGKLTANSGVDIGDVDVTSTSIDKSINGAGAPTIDSYANAVISTSANTANQSLIAAPGASKQIWVYGIEFTAGTGDGTVSFQDEDDTAISGVMEFLQTGGMAIAPSGNFAMPIWKVATNKALEVDTVTCDIKGSIQYAVVSV